MRFRDLLIAAAAMTVPLAASAAIPAVGQTAKGNTFYLENGQALSVDSLKGMVVVVTYWVEECAACNDQIKLIDHYYRRTPDVGLVPLAVSANLTPPRIFRAATRGTKVHGVEKLKGWLGPMSEAPTTYIIDRAGKVRYAGTGVMSVAQLNEVLLPIIREPQPPM